jgi:hypothetical protein
MISLKLSLINRYKHFQVYKYFDSVDSFEFYKYSDPVDSKESKSICSFELKSICNFECLWLIGFKNSLNDFMCENLKIHKSLKSFFKDYVVKVNICD